MGKGTVVGSMHEVHQVHQPINSSYRGRKSWAMQPIISAGGSILQRRERKTGVLTPRAKP